MRQRISQKNVFPVFDIETEYKKLQSLFFDRSAYGKVLPYGRSAPCLSYNDCLKEVFLDWELRGTFTSIEEMLLGLKIGDDDFSANPSEERLLDYIQFITNAVTFLVSILKHKKHYVYFAQAETIFNAIADNAHFLLNRLGAEMINKSGELWVIYKDDVASCVAEQNTDIKESIIEYLKIDNRGNLQRKGEVLCTLAKKLEPHEGKLNATEFKTLCSNTTELLNKIGARHALNDKDHIEKKILNMDIAEQEKWFDYTFQMLLACMAVIPYIDIKNEIKLLKSQSP